MNSEPDRSNDVSTRGSVGRGLAYATASAVGTFLALAVVFRMPIAESMIGVAAAVIFGVPVASTIAIVVGLPFHLMFRRLHIEGLPSYLVVGLISSFVPGMVVELMSWWEGRTARAAFNLEDVAERSWGMIPCGLVAAGVFWLLTVRRETLP